MEAMVANQREAQRDTSPGDGDGSILGELLGVVPRLVERTMAQADLSRRLLSAVPCIGSWLRPRGSTEVPAHEARQPADVLSVVALTDDEAADLPDEPEVTGAVDADATADALPPPAAEDLAISDYDTLAASQVVPRLTMLEASDLEAIGDYERAHRGRRTILNRVAQLLES